jgi:hypothetical protein
MYCTGKFIEGIFITMRKYLSLWKWVMENRAESYFLSFLLGREMKVSTCFPQKINILSNDSKTESSLPFVSAYILQYLDQK